MAGNKRYTKTKKCLLCTKTFVTDTQRGYCSTRCQHASNRTNKQEDQLTPSQVEKLLDDGDRRIWCFGPEVEV